MNELLRMFLSQKDIVDFFKRKRLSGKEITSNELFSAIRNVKGLESLIAAKRTQMALIAEGVITKTPNNLYCVNVDYDFDKKKKKIDLNGWNVALYKRDSTITEPAYPSPSPATRPKAWHQGRRARVASARSN